MSEPGQDVTDLAEIGRQFGMSMRRLGRLHAHTRDACAATTPGTPGHALDRAAYLLLGHVAAEGAARLSDLAVAMGLDISTVSRQVAALEGAGLVGRQSDPADRRASLITVSPAGREIFDCHKRRWQETLGRLLADWTPADRHDFARLLARFNQALSGDLPDRPTGAPAAAGSTGAAGETGAAGSTGGAAAPRGGRRDESAGGGPVGGGATGRESDDNC